MNKIPEIFNRKKVAMHRHRACRMAGDHDFLLQEVAVRINDKLHDLSGGYSNILNIGCGLGQLSELLATKNDVDMLVNQDLSESMVRSAGLLGVVADEEKMPFADESFDLVVSNLALHLVNDVPGVLVQIRKILKPDGVFMASLYGVETLKELRQVMMEVEMEELGGVSARVAPFVEVKTFGQLVQRTGFSQPVADTETIKVSYDGVLELVYDLRGMGEANALVKTGRPINRSVIERIDRVYKEKFGDGDGGIIATFDIINITGLAAIGV